MKKLGLIFLFTVFMLGFSGSQVQAGWPWGDWGVTLPTAIPTPTPTPIKILPLKPILPLYPLSTSTPTPTATLTPTPTIAVSPTPGTTITPTLSITSTPAPTSEPTPSLTPTPKPSATVLGNLTRNERILGGAIIGLLVILVLQNAWPALRKWLHTKTAPKSEN